MMIWWQFHVRDAIENLGSKVLKLCHRPTLLAHSNTVKGSAADLSDRRGGILSNTVEAHHSLWWSQCMGHFRIASTSGMLVLARARVVSGEVMNQWLMSRSMQHIKRGDERVNVVIHDVPYVIDLHTSHQINANSGNTRFIRSQWNWFIAIIISLYQVRRLLKTMAKFCGDVCFGVVGGSSLEVHRMLQLALQSRPWRLSCPGCRSW